jgi:hypothetical protein
MEPVLLAYSLSGAAGLRSSWVLLTIALMIRCNVLSPPAGMVWVGSSWVIGLATVAAVVDFIGDKVPLLDHALHAVHLALAPMVGAVAAMSGFQGDPLTEILVGVLGAGNAVLLHAARSGVRMVSTTATLGLANPVVSILEDIVAVCFVGIAVLAPLVSALLLAWVTIVLSRSIVRTARKSLGS